MFNLIWVIPATIGIITVWAVSAVANYEYGLTQGTADPVHILWFTVTTAQMNGYASLSIDVLKAALPATAVVAWVLGKRMAAIGVAVMFLLCLGWSAQNSVGYVLSNHSRAVDGRGQTADQWKALRQSMDEAERSRGMVPEHRPSAVVGAEIAAAKADSKFALSSSCADPNAGKAVRFCQGYRSLTAELAAAESANQLDTRLKDLRGQLDQRKRISDADPLGTMAAVLLGYHRESVVAGRSVSFSLLVEFISAVGLALIWGTYFAARRDQKEKAELKRQEQAQAAESAPQAEAEPEIVVVEKQTLHVTTPAKPASEPKEAPEREKSSRLGDRLDDIRDRLQEPAAPVSGPTIPPSGGGTRASDPARETVIPIRRSVAELPSYASEMFEESAPPAKVRAQKPKNAKLPGRAVAWIEECTERTSDLSITATEDECWKHYLAWCDMEELKPIGKPKFLRAIDMRIGTAPNGRGYIGLVLLGIVPDEENLRAFA
jgi:hypothetical protein